MTALLKDTEKRLCYYVACSREIYVSCEIVLKIAPCILRETTFRHIAIVGRFVMLAGNNACVNTIRACVYESNVRGAAYFRSAHPSDD